MQRKKNANKIINKLRETWNCSKKRNRKKQKIACKKKKKCIYLKLDWDSMQESSIIFFCHFQEIQLKK